MASTLPLWLLPLSSSFLVLCHFLSSLSPESPSPPDSLYCQDCPTCQHTLHSPLNCSWLSCPDHGPVFPSLKRKSAWTSLLSSQREPRVGPCGEGWVMTTRMQGSPRGIQHHHLGSLLSPGSEPPLCFVGMGVMKTNTRPNPPTVSSLC